MCRDGVSKDKAHMRLNLVWDVKDRKGFYRYISNMKKTKKSVGLLLNGSEGLVTELWFCHRVT